MGAVVTLDDVVTMLIAEAIVEHARTWRPSLRDVRAAILMPSAVEMSIGASTETQRRALRAGWVYR